MGEAKRREDLGPTRKIRFRKYEVIDFITFLVGTQQAPNAKKMKPDAWKPLRRALDQLGALGIWHNIKSKGPVTQKDMPTSDVRELTVDAIDVLISHLNVELDGQQLMNLGTLEERLQDARVGAYDLDTDPADPEPATDATAGGESQDSDAKRAALALVDGQSADS